MRWTAISCKKPWRKGCATHAQIPRSTTIHPNNLSQSSRQLQMSSLSKTWSFVRRSLHQHHSWPESSVVFYPATVVVVLRFQIMSSFPGLHLLASAVKSIFRVAISKSDAVVSVIRLRSPVVKLAPLQPIPGLMQCGEMPIISQSQSVS